MIAGIGSWPWAQGKSETPSLAHTGLDAVPNRQPHEDVHAEILPETLTWRECGQGQRTTRLGLWNYASV